MFQSKKITEGALLVAIYAVILMVSIFVPFVFVIGLFILPVPFIYYTYRHGLQAGLGMLAVALLISLIIIPPLAITVTILAGLGGLIIGLAFIRKVYYYVTCARCKVGFFLLFLFVLLF